ncbi:MAG: hypothetical protein ACT4PI_02920 [Actinomycetota bacterium]
MTGVVLGAVATLGAAPAWAAPPEGSFAGDPADVTPCPATAVPAEGSWQTAPPPGDPYEEPAESGYWDGYWEGEEWVTFWVPYEGASSEPVAPPGQTESPRPPSDPSSPAQCSSGGGETASVAPPAVSSVEEQQAAVERATGGAIAVASGPTQGPSRSHHKAEHRSGPEPAPEHELDTPRFVARALLGPLLGDGLNPLFVFVLGAAGLVLYTLLASTATGRRHAPR